jgi:hypothetical protein
MTDIGYRIEKEREVLATLLLLDYAYQQLPEDFSSDWIEPLLPSSDGIRVSTQGFSKPSENFI